jgi:hypothetical protein
MSKDYISILPKVYAEINGSRIEPINNENDDHEKGRWKEYHNIDTRGIQPENRLQQTDEIVIVEWQKRSLDDIKRLAEINNFSCITIS